MPLPPQRATLPPSRPIAVTRWDAGVLARAVLVAALALVIACLITAATDEGAVPWSQRVARALPLTPVCAAVGAWAALAPVRWRGEARALEALGRSHAQIAAAAVAGGAVVALAAALGIGAVRGIDVAGFYPAVAHAGVWEWHDGAFVNRGRGLRVGEDGVPVRIESEAAAVRDTVPRGGRAAAALVTALAGVALPLLLAQAFLSRPAEPSRSDRARARRTAASIAATGAALAASVVLFQASAARQVPAMFAVAPSCALLAWAIRRYRA